jgi:zinc finger FYVE domain-containing protein 1
VIIDSNEKFLATDLESFRKKLGLTNIDTKLKVISIFGNSGDGKSHTMNSVFFDGEEVFKTSASQNSCTMGVSINYQKFFYNHEILCIDTEGLQGVTQNENQQHRMLMKVLAISDIIIYRTRAERLSIEMYKFLATASKTYLKHFSPMLHSDSSTTAKGPEVIIFHETHNTRPLTNSELNDESSASSIPTL